MTSDVGTANDNFACGCEWLYEALGTVGDEAAALWWGLH